jgi:pSer/pThr/pTyr-binding forkhead associated (FHA) protein
MRNSGPKTMPAFGKAMGDLDERADLGRPAASDAPILARLVVASGPGAGRSFVVRAGTNAVGRGSSNHIDISFGDTLISRREHAYVVAEGGGFRLVHGLGRHGTLVGGRPVSGEVALAIGGTFSIGKTTLELRRR